MTKTKLACLVAVACAGAISACGGNSHTPSADDEADSRAEKLVAQMTLDEKIQMVHGTGIGLGPVGGAGYIPGIPRLGIPYYSTADSANGVAQLKVIDGRLGMVKAGTTPLPSTVALAASWDTTLANEFGTHLAKELRTLGFSEGLGGGINLARELRNGRTFEYMGEDPVLAGNLIVERIKGTQDQKVVATVKHYAANNQETNRDSSNSIIDERTLRELYLLPFEIGVKEGGPGNVMCAYNLVNGEKSCENKSLLTEVLKTEWGFKGKVQSDWGTAVWDTVKAANAGLDEEQYGSSDDIANKTFFNQKLKAAVAAGTVSPSRLDDMVQRRLRTYVKVGIMDSPAPGGGTIDQAAGDVVALKVAEQSMVLLKNEARASAEPALPLKAAAVKTIVVIGGHADAGVISGGGSALTIPRDGKNAVNCSNPAAPVACALWYKSPPLDAIRAKAPNAVVTYLDGSNLAAAAEAAKQADVAIVFGFQWQTENIDLPSLSLPNTAADPFNYPYDQNALITAVAAAAKRSIVVLQTGTAVTMPWVGNVDAVLEAWYPGVQGGQAIANVLFGDVNPSGKLPITFPSSESDMPQTAISATDKDVVYKEGLLMGYRWYDAKNIAPLFPFGHGLSYTSFSYSGGSSQVNSAGDVTISFTLTNTGKVAGAEVAQIYAALPDSGEPPKRLIGFKKIFLSPGESRSLSVTVKAARLAIWDTTAKKWRLPDGKFTFYVGRSSRDPQPLTSSQTVKGRLLVQ